MTARASWAVAFLACIGLVACGAGGGGNSDCSEARPPAKTQGLGAECTAFYYGSCPTLFSDCAEGTCAETASDGWLCLAPCGTCSSGYSCKGGVCQPWATCSYYCETSNGITICCDYTQCQGDPTQCCQVPASCSVS